jgi:hypothetical protein
MNKWGGITMSSGTSMGIKSDYEVEESVALMLDMREKFPEIPADIDINKIKRLQRVLPEIINHLSPSDKAVLDGLMKNSNKVLENETWRNMAVGIMSSHLKKYPKDLDVLINAYRGVMTWDTAQKYTNMSRGRDSY